jgi:hypothetical protein
MKIENMSPEGHLHVLNYLITQKQQQCSHMPMFHDPCTVEPWIASIIRSRNVFVIQNTRISK